MLLKEGKHLGGLEYSFTYEYYRANDVSIFLCMKAHTHCGPWITTCWAFENVFLQWFWDSTFLLRKSLNLQLWKEPGKIFKFSPRLCGLSHLTCLFPKSFTDCLLNPHCLPGIVEKQSLFALWSLQAHRESKIPGVVKCKRVSFCDNCCREHKQGKF